MFFDMQDKLRRVGIAQYFLWVQEFLEDIWRVLIEWVVSRDS